MSRELRARLVADLRPHLAELTPELPFGIGWDGAFHVAERIGNDYRVSRWLRGGLETVTVSSVSLGATYVQPHPEGILLVGARCRWTAEKIERNALIADASGRVLRELTLGDGIQDVRVTRDGTIWVSYFDEGVFGNYGWGHPGPAPIGSPGLLAFSSSGRETFRFEAKRAGTGTIADAYALNVTPEGDVWVYYYTDFPIVRIAQGSYTAWSYGAGGARALAVRGDRVFLFGSYGRGPDRARAQSLRLGDDRRARVLDEVSVVDEAGAALERATAVGVGERLYFLQDGRVHVLEDW